MLMLDKEKKEWLVCCVWFLKRFKSRKGTTLQCGQSHRGNLATKIVHFERMCLDGLFPNSY